MGWSVHNEITNTSMVVTGNTTFKEFATWYGPEIGHETSKWMLTECYYWLVTGRRNAGFEKFLHITVTPLED